MRRIERLINLIAALLDARVPLTAEEIRDRIAGYDQETHEAFRRAFERDKETLRGLGIPLETRKVDPLYEGSPDGYLIPKERYYLPDLDLEPDEAAALRIAADAVLGSAEAARAGLMKLQIDVPQVPASGPRPAWTADFGSEQPYLSPLYEAVLKRTPIRFSYLRAGEAAPENRTVEPYGLVNRRGRWYLVCRDRDRGAPRAFKLSRIRGNLRHLEGTYEVPDDFDPAEHLPREAWELGEESETTTVVRFDEPMRWWAEQNLTHLESEEGPAGSLDVSVPVANLDALISWVIGFGDGVEIAAPESARARLEAHLEPFLD